MGIVKKMFILFSLCSILTFAATETEEMNENEVLNSKEISEQVEEEEVLTGKSLFYENSNLIRIEVRENNVRQFDTEKSKNQNQNQNLGSERENINSEREITTSEDSQESEKSES